MRVLLELVEIRGLKKKSGNKKVPKLGSLWINSDQTRALLGYHHRQKEHTNFLTGEKKKDASIILYFPESIQIAVKKTGCHFEDVYSD